MILRALINLDINFLYQPKTIIINKLYTLKQMMPLTYGILSVKGR